MSSVDSVGLDRRWGDCGQGDVQVRSGDRGLGALRQGKGAFVCLAQNSLAHLAGSLVQAPSSSITLGKFSQLFLAPGGRLSLAGDARISQDPDSYYAELNVHQSLDLGEEAAVGLGTYAYAFVDGPLSLEDKARLELGFRASLYVYGCRGAACLLGPAASLVLEAGAAFTNKGSLAITAGALATLGPGAVLEAEGDLELDKGQLRLGERAKVTIGPGAALKIEQRAGLRLGQGAELALGPGSTLHLLGEGGQVEIGARGAVSVEADVFCVLLKGLDVPEGAPLLLDPTAALEGLECHPAVGHLPSSKL